MERRTFLKLLPIGIGVTALGYRITKDGPVSISNEPLIETINYKNQTINFIGVSHDNKTVRSSGSLIANSTNTSQLIIVEGLPFTEDTYGGPFQGMGGDFYNYITELAKKNNQLVGCLDPADDTLSMLYTNSFMGVTSLTEVGAGIGLLATKKINRRKFLAYTGIGTTSFTADFLLNYQTSPAFILINYILRGKDYINDFSSFSGINKEVADQTNFRSAVVALRLKHLLDETTQQGKSMKISLIYGMAHIPAIQYFLNNPTETENLLKRPESLINGLFDRTEERFYKPSSNGWQQFSSTDLLKEIS